MPLIRNRHRFISNHAALYAPAPAASTSTWDPASKDTNVTLSSGDLVAEVANPASGNYLSVKSTTGFTTGKKYLELEVVTKTNNLIQMGLCDSTRTGSHAAYRLDNSAQTPAGSYFTYNNTMSNSATSAGDRVSMAVDFTAGKLFIGRNGVFNENAGTQDPAAGSNATMTWTPDATSLYIYLAIWDDSSPASLKIHPSAATQSYSPPSGYSAWG